MISHYLILAKKALFKNKYYTFINVFGLVCGMLSALIIAKYIGGSLHFDSFHIKKDRIYSVTQEESIDGNPQKKRNTTYWGVGELINQYPEVINSTRLSFHVASLIITDGETDNRVSFIENKIFSTDSNFLKIFTFPLIFGSPETALSRDKSIVLTRSISQKYFGNANPIGKVLTIRVPWGEETMYKITGVLEDTPQKSHFRFDFLIPQSKLNTNQFWDFPDYSTYVLLKENIKADELAKHLMENVNDEEPLKLKNRKVIMSLESLANVALTGTEYLLAAVGIFIIFISWVNYVNQIIVQSYGRIKEIGILRIMGATRVNLITQFIVESSLICLTSMILIIVIYLSLEPSLQSFTNGHLLPMIKDPTLINFFFLAIFIIGITLAATIPTVVLFSQNFITTLRNGNSSKIGSIGLRKALVMLQFTISSILMISIFVITNQLEYMNNKDKGINMENIIIIKSPIEKDTWNNKRERLELFKEKCAELPFVIGITSSTTIPSEEYRHETYFGFQEKEDKSLLYLNGVDDDFLSLYDVKFIAGYNFLPDAVWKNRKSIIINESAANALGIVDFDKIVDTKLVNYEENEIYELIGIVKNYHKTSLKYEIKPMAFNYNPIRGHFSLRINKAGSNDNALKEKLSSIKQIWEQVYHTALFDYFFLDEKFESQDMEDRYFGKLFKFFTILSIIISCLGLFGLSLLVSTKRQREIGISKVFGAKSINILTIFLKGYLGSIGASILIGSPLAYLLMNMWLKNYSYRIDIGFWLVSSAVLSLTLIFLFTVSYHTLKSSISNPVTILRD